MIGSPVSNCQDGSNSTVTSTVGGSVTIGDAWSVSDSESLGFSIFGLEVTGGASSSWSESRSIAVSQSISIQIQPGQKVWRICAWSFQNATNVWIQGCSGCHCSIQTVKWIYESCRKICFEVSSFMPSRAIQESNAPISSPEAFPVVSDQPITILSIGPEMVSCTSEFNASDLNALRCMNHGEWLGETVSAPLLTSLTVILTLGVYFL